MTNFSKRCLKELPFYDLSRNHIIKLFQSEKDLLFERLANNEFSKNMLKHVNGFSKDNYTCGYYQENSIQNLVKKTSPRLSKNNPPKCCEFQQKWYPLCILSSISKYKL